MSGGNYDEGIERSYIANAAANSDPLHLQAIQKKRSREKVIGAAIALGMFLCFFGLLQYFLMAQKMDREKAKEYLQTTIEHINSGDYDAALKTADVAIGTDNYEWRGHYFKSVALFHLQQFENSRREILEMGFPFVQANDIPANHLALLAFLKDKARKQTTEKNLNILKQALGDEDALIRYLEKQEICYPTIVTFDSANYQLNIAPLRCFENSLIEKAEAFFKNN